MVRVKLVWPLVILIMICVCNRGLKLQDHIKENRIKKNYHTTNKDARALILGKIKALNDTLESVLIENVVTGRRSPRPFRKW